MPIGTKAQRNTNYMQGLVTDSPSPIGEVFGPPAPASMNPALIEKTPAEEEVRVAEDYKKKKDMAAANAAKANAKAAGDIGAALMNGPAVMPGPGPTREPAIVSVSDVEKATGRKLTRPEKKITRFSETAKTIEDIAADQHLAELRKNQKLAELYGYVDEDPENIRFKQVQKEVDGLVGKKRDNIDMMAKLGQALDYDPQIDFSAIAKLVDINTGSNLADYYQSPVKTNKEYQQMRQALIQGIANEEQNIFNEKKKFAEYKLTYLQNLQKIRSNNELKMATLMLNADKLAQSASKGGISDEGKFWLNYTKPRIADIKYHAQYNRVSKIYKDFKSFLNKNKIDYNSLKTMGMMNVAPALRNETIARYKAFVLNMSNAILRLESGAATPEFEFKRKMEELFPQGSVLGAVTPESLKQYDDALVGYIEAIRSQGVQVDRNIRAMEKYAPWMLDAGGKPFTGKETGPAPVFKSGTVKTAKGKNVPFIYKFARMSQEEKKKAFSKMSSKQKKDLARDLEKFRAQ